MSRKAILIGAPGSGNDFLPGVDADLRNYSAFLKSAKGGVWFDDEIQILKNPTTALLDFTLRSATQDFTFLMFAGHGEMRGDITYAWINDRERCSTLDMNTSSRKQLVIIDACRKQVKEEIRLDSIDFAEALALTKRGFDHSSLRSAFDEAVRAADPGRSTIYSCSRDESAGDTRAGGEFSRRLLGTCVDWPGTSSWQPAALVVPTAFQATRAGMERARVPQVPELENGRRQCSFPLAVG